jgi:hypothetical protein
VKDTTGAVLPGVTVEARSPALIEKVRSVVTDASGEYKIVDLRTGEYSVTFTLTGFNASKRDGIQLTAGITVSVDMELRVGSMQETVTVSAQGPLVDVQNTTQHIALTRQVLDDLPTGRNFGNYGVLIPGVVTNIQDVGGSSANVTTTNIMGVHGSNANEMPMVIDGMRYGNIFGTGGGASGPYIINNGMVEEVAVDVSGAGAEAEVGGFRSNVILRQGGNKFSSYWYGGGSGDKLLSNNIDDALRNRGALTPSATTRQWDFNVGFGGPIKRDEIWFYASYRNYGSNQEPTGAYRALDPTAVVFRPPTIVNGVITAPNSADLSNPAVNDLRNQNFNGRVTIQTSKNSKLSLYGDQMPRIVGANGLGATTTFEATTRYFNDINSIIQATWNWTITNRLLLDVGETYKPDSWEFGPQRGIDTSLAPVQDTGTGITSRGRINAVAQTSNQHNGKAVLTYVTGSSSTKFGGQWFSGGRTAYTYTNGDYVLVLRNGVPQFVTQQTTPLQSKENLKLNFGAFVQEQYTWRHVTLNAGLRFDYLNEYIPEQNTDPVRFAPALRYPRIDDIPNWKDISPRLGVSWDVFGTSRTALKFNIGRFVEAQAAGFPQAVNPTRAAGTTSGQRTWTDANGNFKPDCELTNLSANGECGAMQNPNFGKPATAAYRMDPAAVTGWGTRGYNWEVMAGVQHQLTDGLSIDASYNRRWFGNQRVFQAAGVTPDSYDPFCVTTPSDSRLPGGGNQAICGFNNIKPQFVGLDQTNILITKASNFGKVDEHYDGVDVAMKMRLPRGLLLQGGLSIGRAITNWCDVVSGRPDIRVMSTYVNVSGGPSSVFPQFSTAAPFCAAAQPFQTQVKLSGVLPLRWNFVTSATYQSLVYPQDFYGTFGGILAARAFTNAEIVPSLGRNLSTGSSAVLQMVPASSLYGDRLHQIDWRITRNFNVRGGRIQPQLDLYNLLNANPVLAMNNTYGPLWQQPTQILLGRVIKFGVQANF